MIFLQGIRTPPPPHTAEKLASLNPFKINFFLVANTLEEYMQTFSLKIGKKLHTKHH